MKGLDIAVVITIPEDVASAEDVMYRPGYLRVLWRYKDGTQEWYEYQALITGERLDFGLVEDGER